MARNPVQFQKGMSLAEFNARYGTEQQCHSALVAMRWPDGFVCPKCAAREHSYHAGRRLFQCTTCLTQTSVTAGTIFHKSRTPLDKWFLTIHLITQSKNDIAALELSRQLGVKWDTAWLIKQKLMGVMRECNQTYKLEGEVQIDERFELEKMVDRLVAVAAKTTPRPYKTIVNAETSGHRGNQKSYHLSGDAVDLRVFGNIGATYASSRGHGSVGGLKHYGGGLFHIDTGPRRSW
jgi:ribosomal protein L37AE/L43A